MRKKRAASVLLPSASSGFGVLFVSATILTIAFVAYTAGNGIIYSYLFGPNSSGELIKTSRGTITAFNNTVFGNPTLNKILFFAFWMLVGLVVYVILYSLIRSTSSAAEDISESRFMNISRDVALHNFEVRLAIRGVALLGWIIYWIFFTKILLPFSILTTRMGATDFSHLNGWLYGLLGLVVLTVSLHVHLVFLRLVVLRTRLFDSSDVVG